MKRTQADEIKAARQARNVRSARGSSSGGNSHFRNSITTNSCIGFKIVASRYEVCERSWTVSRARQRRTVVSLAPNSTANSAAERIDGWMLELGWKR